PPSKCRSRKRSASISYKVPEPKRKRPDVQSTYNYSLEHIDSDGDYRIGHCKHDAVGHSIVYLGSIGQENPSYMSVAKGDDLEGPSDCKIAHKSIMFDRQITGFRSLDGRNRLGHSWQQYEQSMMQGVSFDNAIVHLDGESNTENEVSDALESCDRDSNMSWEMV
ncbi:hypothetical protein MPH_13681, partial [Macrophomina phaseolina MS6]